MSAEDLDHVSVEDDVMYTTGVTEESDFRKCHCRISADENGNITYEINEDIETLKSQITAVTASKHDNVLCLSCGERRCTFVQFSKRSLRDKWYRWIGEHLPGGEMTEADDFRERAETGDASTAAERRPMSTRTGREGKAVSSPAAPEGMFTPHDDDDDPTEGGDDHSSEERVQTDSECPYAEVPTNIPKHPRPLARRRGNLKLDKMKVVYEDRTITSPLERQPTWPLRKLPGQEHPHTQETADDEEADDLPALPPKTKDRRKFSLDSIMEEGRNGDRLEPKDLIGQPSRSMNELQCFPKTTPPLNRCQPQACADEPLYVNVGRRTSAPY